MNQIGRPRNWENFQHYKNRRPPWIKSHHALLDDREYQRLPLASRALAPSLWLLASESKDGSFDISIEELTFRLRQPVKDIEAGLKPLIDAGFFTVEHVASTALADCQHVAPKSSSEKSREETEIEQAFESFWSAYPSKVAKPTALKEFKAVKAHKHMVSILENIDRRKSGDGWQKDGGKWIPNPAKYLKERRWEDEIQVQQPARSALLARVI
jgi:hypothetical protein